MIHTALVTLSFNVHSINRWSAKDKETVQGEYKSKSKYTIKECRKDGPEHRCSLHHFAIEEVMVASVYILARYDSTEGIATVKNVPGLRIGRKW